MMATSVTATMATDYTDKLTVTLNGTEIVSKQDVINVEKDANGNYTLSINNFSLDATSPIGNIVVKDVQPVQDGEAILLMADQMIQITPGTATEWQPGDWMGPMLGNVPVEVSAEIRGEKLYAIIDIDMMSTLKQLINVQFGDGGYQIGNSGFENFHTATASSATSDEPNNWHSFMSCTGPLAAFVSSVPHTFISNDVRPGTSGSKSVLVKSGLALGSIVANGTLTTGRLMAGGFTPESTDNNAFLDITSTDVDANGDPFYSLVNGCPDSLAVWVKFKQESPVAEHPYATITAVITDGSFYQEPVDKDYTDSIVCKAADTKIESKGFIWQRLSMPFDYESYTKKDPKAILVTISTNADPGQGTGNDSLLVDDLELIYNSTVTGISLRGEALAGFEADSTEYWVTIKNGSTDVKADEVDVTTDAKGMKVSVSSVDVDCIGGGSDITVTAMGGDLKNRKTYVIHTRSEEYMTGIGEVEAEGDTVEAVYNLSGQRVETLTKGQVYVVKYANGKTVKTVKK